MTLLTRLNRLTQLDPPRCPDPCHAPDRPNLTGQPRPVDYRLASLPLCPDSAQRPADVTCPRCGASPLGIRIVAVRGDPTAREAASGP